MYATTKASSAVDVTNLTAPADEVNTSIGAINSPPDAATFISTHPAENPTDRPNSDSDQSKTDASRDEADLLSPTPDEQVSAPLSETEAAEMWNQVVTDEVCSDQSPSKSSDKLTTETRSHSSDINWTSDSEGQSSGNVSETDQIHHGGEDENEGAGLH